MLLVSFSNSSSDSAVMVGRVVSGEGQGGVRRAIVKEQLQDGDDTK